MGGPGYRTGIGAIDIALHDIAGKAAGKPVHELIGDKVRDAIPVLTMVGNGDPTADAADAAGLYTNGYR